MPASGDGIDVMISRGGFGQEVGFDKPYLIGKVHWERFAPWGQWILVTGTLITN